MECNNDGFRIIVLKSKQKEDEAVQKSVSKKLDYMINFTPDTQ